MTQPTRIHLVRHGTTLLNRQQRYRGRLDVPLDEGGWRDAWSAADELSGAGITAVYSSPLRRARDTARIVADAVGLTTVTDLPGLVNLDYGDWDALTPEEVEADYADDYEGYRTYRAGAAPTNGEPLDVAAARMVLSLRMIALLHPGQAVAAVSHAATVRLAISATSQVAPEDWRCALPNGCVTVFEATATDAATIRIPDAVATSAD